ncbi:MAG: restriction endonuclease subunit S [Chloroflexota bacterium]|nr:MAG: restriction endonuclease subunit S [Chloroflexota bacterium]
MAGEGWHSRVLGDLIEVRHGFAFAGEFFRDDPPGDILLTPGNFAIGGGFKADKLKYYAGPVPDDFVLKDSDLLVTMTDLSKNSDTLGYPALVPKSFAGRFLHNQRLGKVIIRDGAPLQKRFLYYLLCSREYRQEVMASASGSTVKHTSPGRIAAFKFLLPPEPEQRAIAHILGTLDDKIELNRRMNETLEAMARALFKSWFVDFDPVRAKAKGRDPGLPPHLAELFPDSFEGSELGEIPRGWRVAILGQIAEVIDCLHSKKPDRQKEGLPLLQLSNIRDDGLIDMQETYFIDEASYQDRIARMEASPGDCVVTNVGRVGAVAQMPVGLKAALGRNMTGIRCRRSFPFPTFLIECLLSSAMRDEIALKTDTGTILDALNVRNVPNLRFVCSQREPPVHFEEMVRPLRARMEALLLESRTLAALRDTLLPRLTSGELRVIDLRHAVGEK